MTKRVNGYMIDALLSQINQNAENLFNVGPKSWRKNKHQDLKTIKRTIKIIRDELNLR